jgi:DNA-binding transcriptional LysR family regulator
MESMGDLDLWRLRSFLTLADELNYGRAAEVLHIAQPALSRSIATLERELRVTLFERSRSGTHLAAAGESLRTEARSPRGTPHAPPLRLNHPN